ncbi:uncharacterized protein LOC141655949 [Silene latifolia]|uniref:uncharacterized protein LOC141655949 n=1 Tax=Silene latifolia TaxID=37657 RepID=UPI003D78905C
MIRSILNKTPYESLRGRKPNISYFRCFGSKCFVHNNGKNNLGKFDPRSDEGVFIGYSDHSKAYKVYNKRTLLIEESIHVIFDESSVLGQVQNMDDDDEDEDDEFEIGLVRKDFVFTDEEAPSTELQQTQRLSPSKESSNSGGTRSTSDSSLEATDPTTVASTSRTEVTQNSEDEEPSRPIATVTVTDDVEGEQETIVPKKWKHQSSHPLSNLTSDLNSGIRTRSSVNHLAHLNEYCAHNAFLSQIEPSNVTVALTDADWVLAMQDELNQFKRNEAFRMRTMRGARWIERVPPELQRSWVLA